MIKIHSPRTLSAFDLGINPATGEPLRERVEINEPRPGVVAEAGSAGDNVPFDFGKYRGKTAVQIAALDVSYLLWLDENVPSRKGYVSPDLLARIKLMMQA